VKYVYVYTDPSTGAVRYVGSGSRYRMWDHSKPSILNNPKHQSPFYTWMRDHPGVNWGEHRMIIAGPMSQAEALEFEQQLIEKHYDTVLNSRTSTNGFMRAPKIRGLGIRRANAQGDWRAQAGAGSRDRRVYAKFPTFCEAVKWKRSQNFDRNFSKSTD